MRVSRGDEPSRAGAEEERETEPAKSLARRSSAVARWLCRLDDGFSLCTSSVASSAPSRASTLLPTQSSSSRRRRLPKVALVVSSGPPLVEIPQVQGKNVDAARKQLEDLGFTVKVENFLGGVFGTVRESNPGAGQSIPKGSTITLTVV